LHYADFLVFLLIPGALGLSRIIRKQTGHFWHQTLLSLAVAGWILYFSIPFGLGHARELRSRYEVSWRIARMVEALPEPALVFLPQELDSEPGLRINLALNARGMESPVLRLQARPEDYRALAESFPDRTVYALQVDPLVDLTPVEARWQDLSRSAANSHHFRGTGVNEPETGSRTARAGRDQAGFLFYGWYPFLPPGTYECRFELRWSEVDEDAPVRIEMMTHLGKTSLGKRELAGGLEETVIQFTLDEALQVEPRVYFGGSGSVTLRDVRVRRVVAEREPPGS
jgi:hypothetical protein